MTGSENTSTSGDGKRGFSHSFIEEHLPDPDQVQFSLGPYKVLKNIATGGMGEVFLAYDTICGRKIALKRIRKDLIDFKKINNRFLKEAHITSQLTHPSIIPIYNIHCDGDTVYYTMPYVQGETLKQILRKTRRQEKSGEKIDYIGGSIPALIRIYINICQAVAYAHSKGILHRDLKPENIIVGQYGEVLILDWGLAKRFKDGDSAVAESEKVEEADGAFTELTLAGKVVGTVNFMAPERSRGLPATFQTDIYSLGVILFQILTLRYPFKRTSLKEFKKNIDKEFVHDPVSVAPYRDIPRILAHVAVKCLEKEPLNRYQSVEDIIFDIQNYLEGRAEWFQIAQLDPKNKKDWEFQENVYLAEHVAITRATETSEWLNLMISRSSFAENIRLEANILFGDHGNGIGFLLNVPEVSERKQLNDGYCLWLGTEINPSTKLMRAAVEVIYAPETILKCNKWHHIRIDKIDTHIHVYVDNKLQFSYISHLPLVGTHVGLLSRDADYEIEELKISVVGQNVMVKCLAVPDAFLAAKNYSAALSEYRRIGYSFPGRAEGREALFRAGITLLEQAKNCSDITKKEALLDEALDEFELLHSTPGAPLEYLGKALVYKSLNEIEEEVKCFELAYRRYPNHPLLSILQEQIAYRLHESSRTSRRDAYQFVLLTVRHLPSVVSASHVQRLLFSLQKHWEPLPFIDEEPSSENERLPSANHFAIMTAFWLARPYILEEIIEKLKAETPQPVATICNALFSLIKLGCWKLAADKLAELDLTIPSYAIIDQVIAFESGRDDTDLTALLSTLKGPLSFGQERLLVHLASLFIRKENWDAIHTIGSFASSGGCCEPVKQRIEELDIWAYLSERKWEEAGALLNRYPVEILSHDGSLLHLLYGCWLLVTEGDELANIHFSGILEIPYPRSWTLLSHFLGGRISENDAWFQRAFLWEKRQLYKQIQLYYHCIGDLRKSTLYGAKAEEHFLDIF